MNDKVVVRESPPMKRGHQLCCAVLLAAGLTVTTYSQAATSTADLRGVVSDENGAVVPNATVTLTNIATGASRTAATDQTGNLVSLGFTLAFLSGSPQLV